MNRQIFRHILLISGLLTSLPALAASAPLSLAVITVTQTSTTTPRTNAFTRAYKDGHHASFTEQSLGKWTFGPTVTYGPYVRHPEVGCFDYGKAKALAAPDGYVATNFWQTVVLMPDCGANYPEHWGSWPLYNDWAQHDFIQEGFVLGIFPQGMGRKSCTDVNGQWVMLSNTCTVYLYGDVGPTGSGDDIGLGHYPFNAKLAAGIVSTANRQIVTVDGDYTVLPLEFPTSGIQQLRILEPGTIWSGEPLDMEFRRRTRFEMVQPAPCFDGLVLHAGGYLLVPQPTTICNYPILPVGASVYDPVRKVTLTVLSADDAKARVRVTFGAQPPPPSCVATTPTVTVSPAAQTLAPGGSATYTVTVVNKDSSACAPAMLSVAATATPGSPAPPTAGTSATYVRTDTTTLGSWKGKYGAAGYIIPSDVQALPAWAQFSAASGTLTNWGFSGMAEWLQTAAGSTRIASFWLSPTLVDLSVNLTDGQSHQVALYAFAGGCGDGQPNNPTVDVVDGSGVVLDSRAFTPSARYVVWTVRGNVRFRVRNGHCSNVVNGVFFD